MAKRSIFEQDSVADLEETLVRTLRPVNPDPQFVDRLHQRLVTPPAFVIERQSRAVGLLILAGGLVTGLALLLLARWLYRMVTRAED